MGCNPFSRRKNKIYCSSLLLFVDVFFDITLPFSNLLRNVREKVIIGTFAEAIELLQVSLPSETFP
jgi:hypothetical protein